jgi:hypothetical protein
LRRSTTVLVVSCIGLFPVGQVCAAEPTTTQASPADTEGTMVLSPRGDPYAPYLADPHRASFELLSMSVTDVDIADSGESRYGLKLGGRFGIARHDPPGRPGEGWQIGFEIGFVGEFDRDRQYDNIGWDGIYGVLVTMPLLPTVQTKFGTMHRSSHVGDEYMERVGRARINYTREEILAGLSWYFAPAWRMYGEYGHAYQRGNEALQEKGRLQAGLEYQPKREGWGGQLGWFAALDVSAMEERDWTADTAARIGYLFDADGRRWALSAMYYHGRPTTGEFFQHTESYFGVSIRLEL